MQNQSILENLLSKGVRIPRPETVEIGSDLNPGRISGERVTIHSGCRLYGEKTLVMSGAELGHEGPTTVMDCQLGRDVKLKGGFFYNSCFLEGSELGSGAQIREGCLLEEGARAAHTVGLKQTILFPFVVLGSLVNFCDCLMAGGTGRKNHSEVGSSYIHFNFTPNQDKAAPSLIGDVPRGVMINQPPIFLGGQGGLVGPLKITYGTVVAAGTILRKDFLKQGMILLGQKAPSRSMPFKQGLYTNIFRIIELNTNYIANLIALRRWYLDVRSGFTRSNTMDEALLKGAVEKIESGVLERIKRLGEVSSRMPRSIELYQKKTGASDSEKVCRLQKEFLDRWPEMEDTFKAGMDQHGDPSLKDNFIECLGKGPSEGSRDYLETIRNLEKKGTEAGTKWLQGIVDRINGSVLSLLPGVKK